MNRGRVWSAMIGGTRTNGVTTTYTIVGLGASPSPLSVSLVSPTATMTLTGAGTQALNLGNNSYTIRMTNTAGFDETVSCYLFVSPARSISCGNYSSGTQTVFLTALLNGSGTLPLTYAVTAGSGTSLPASLSLNPSSGFITGIVGTTVTSQSTSFSVTDRFGTSTVVCSFTAGSAPSMSCNNSARFAIVGTNSYSRASVNCARCTGYTTSTSLPGGLVLSAGSQVALLSATTVTMPTTAGPVLVSIRGFDADGAFSTIQCPVEVVAPFSISCPPAITVNIGQRFATGVVTFLTGAAANPVVFSVKSGAVLTGAILDSNTGSVFVSVPSGLQSQNLGAYPYSLSVVDAAGQTATTGLCSITVQDRLVITCPPDQTLSSGSPYVAFSSASGGSGSYTNQSIIGFQVVGHCIGRKHQRISRIVFWIDSVQDLLDGWNPEFGTE